MTPASRPVLPRRVLLTRAASLLLMSVIFAVSTGGCDKSESAVGGTTPSTGPSAGGGSGSLTVGFIYVGGKDDYGYNQATTRAQAVAKMPGVKILEMENVKETNDVQKAMEGMITGRRNDDLSDQLRLLRSPHAEVARKYPKLTFRHCGGLFDAAKHPANTGSYFGYIDECQYIAGIVAGKTSKTGKLGFIAAKPIPQVLRNINAFTLGAQSVNPKVTTSVIFTGEWFMPNKEAEAVNSLADQGGGRRHLSRRQPEGGHRDRQARGIYSCGYHANGSALAPSGYLTGAEWNWATVYTNYVTSMKEGKPLPGLVRGGLKDGFVKTSPYGPGRLRRDQEAGRRREGNGHGREADHFQRAPERQHGQDGHRGGKGNRPDRSDPREDGLPGGRCDRLGRIEIGPTPPRLLGERPG